MALQIKGADLGWLIGLVAFFILFIVFRRWVIGGAMMRKPQPGIDQTNSGLATADQTQNVLHWLQGEIAETIAAVENEPKAASTAAGAWLKEEFQWQVISTPDYSIDDQFKYIVDVLKVAVEKRQAAVAGGAAGREEPTWAAAALIESWATLLVGVYQGRWNYKQAEVADILAELDAFSRRRLSREERERIRAEALRLF